MHKIASQQKSNYTQQKSVDKVTINNYNVTVSNREQQNGEEKKHEEI
nr:MAG TPA: hypothetical protein [Bacteriophage sp.]